MAEFISLYSNTSLLSAYDTPISIAERFVGGKMLSNWTKSKESELAGIAAIAHGINAVIKSIGYLARALSKR